MFNLNLSRRICFHQKRVFSEKNRTLEAKYLFLDYLVLSVRNFDTTISGCYNDYYTESYKRNLLQGNFHCI